MAVRKHEEILRQARIEHQTSRADLVRQMEEAQKASQAEMARVQRRLEAQLADLRATGSRLEVDLLKANKSKSQELQAAHDKFNVQKNDMETVAAELRRKVKDLEAKLAAASIQEAELREMIEAAEEDNMNTREKLQAAEKDVVQTREKLQAAEKRLKEAEDALQATREEKKATQTELDDLLMVFADLEEKSAGYKARLRQHGESLSDDEDGYEDEEDDEDEDEGEGEDDDLKDDDVD
ncbi:hypothetical protein HMPREF1624_08495 [Sporothrix schenckii ATCC 58251]|uniref:Uso1/p115-like vesicle tethering protein C-terminal domain-containing protein n=2 Tax=Sporothrix schenckii TaxID=29908 RepID=U7PJC0_SPOS1|nr:hypothetical protein HMPREF1624_08495 [Sporothrix schenckii ATCC 58251]